MEMLDSGKRQSFGEGAAVRDSAEGKPKMSLLGPWAWQHLPFGQYVGEYMLDHDIKHMQTMFEKMIDKYGWDCLCNWLELGAKKYDTFNWAKGMQVTRCLDSLGRHLVKLAKGMDDEDHAAAALCNIMFIIHYHLAIQCGLLSQSFMDLFDFDRMFKDKPSELRPESCTINV